MRRQLTTITVLLAIVGCFSALCRGAEDLSPVLTILAKRATAQAGGTSPALPAPVGTATISAAPQPSSIRAQAPVIKAAPRGYPTRGRLWTHPGNLRSHILSDVHHSGKFDAAWVNTLTASQLEALHSDDHEGRVNWNYAVRASKASGHWETFKVCRNGRCSYQRRWIAD